MPTSATRSRRADLGSRPRPGANAQAGLENVALWHERDISHSSVERVILPDSTILLDYLSGRDDPPHEGMTVDEERMLSNLELTHGALFSQRVLLALVAAGMSPRRGLPGRAGAGSARIRRGHPPARAARRRPGVRPAWTSMRSSITATTCVSRGRSSGDSSAPRASGSVRLTAGACTRRPGARGGPAPPGPAPSGGRPRHRSRPLPLLASHRVSTLADLPLIASGKVSGFTVRPARRTRPSPAC